MFEWLVRASGAGQCLRTFCPLVTLAPARTVYTYSASPPLQQGSGSWQGELSKPSTCVLLTLPSMFLKFLK